MTPSPDALRDAADQADAFFVGWTPWHWMILLIPFLIYGGMEWWNWDRRRRSP